MMSPLSQALQVLKRPSKSWNLIIVPDPKKFHGYRRQGQDGYNEFRLKLQQDANLETYLQENPSFGTASNVNSGVIANLKASLGKPDSPSWVMILDNDRKNTDGQSVREVLVDLLQHFPSYDLASEKGTEKAISDIERRISSVASVEHNTSSVDH